MPVSSSPARRIAFSWRGLLRPSSQDYLLALAFFVVVFAIIPFTIYADSGDDWGFPYYQLLYVCGLGLILCVGTMVVIRLLALVHQGSATTLACLLFCLGVFLLLAHVYAPLKLGPLDGSEMVSSEPLLDSVVEAGFAALLAVVLVQLLRGRGHTIAALFSLALVMVALGYLGAFAYAHQASLRPLKAPAAGSPRVDGDIYQIVLDTMQTDAFLAALGRAGLSGAFTGFDVFRNNISNYITTVSSSASYFTGRFYQEGDHKAWTRNWRRAPTGLLPTLAKRRYRIWMYSPFPQWDNKYVDRFRYNVDIYEQDSGFADTGLYDLIQIWLTGLSPNVLTNEALPVAARLRDRTFELLTGKSRPLALQEGLHPHAGAMMLRRLAREEDLRAPNGQYVYAHARCRTARSSWTGTAATSASGRAARPSGAAPSLSRRNARSIWSPTSSITCDALAATTLRRLWSMPIPAPAWGSWTMRCSPIGRERSASTTRRCCPRSMRS